MIEKLNLREAVNGAHGAQSTVVEGASLKPFRNLQSAESK